MPAETPRYQPREEILTFEEITRFSRIAVGLGVDDIRLTGGEPLVRAQLHRLLAELAKIDGLKKIALTTNGILLRQQLPDLYGAGLRAINVSLDALDEDAFRQSTRRGGLSQVLEGIQAAVDLGVAVKINAIAMRDFTEPQIDAFGNFTRQTGIPVRFIEFMPLDAQGQWDAANVLSGKRILELFSQSFPTLVPVDTDAVSPATDFEFSDGVGRIGIIPSVTQPFCQSCNRFRLTADGQLRNCLFGEDSGDVRLLLRNGATDSQISQRIGEAIASKRAGHGTDDLSFLRPSRPMYAIGG
jgi:cyclic pyranopterin phosphate synthase